MPWQHGRGKKAHILAVAKFDDLPKIGVLEKQIDQTDGFFHT
jgi:hypothetical protein